MLDSVTDLKSLLKDPSLLATKAYVAGEWIGAEPRFRSDPAHGPAHEFSSGNPDLVDRACQAAGRTRVRPPGRARSTPRAEPEDDDDAP